MMDRSTFRQMLRHGLPPRLRRDPETRRLLGNAKRRIRRALKRRLNRIVASSSRGVGAIHGIGEPPLTDA